MNRRWRAPGTDEEDEVDGDDVECPVSPALGRRKRASRRIRGAPKLNAGATVVARSTTAMVGEGNREGEREGARGMGFWGVLGFGGCGGCLKGIREVGDGATHGLARPWPADGRHALPRPL